jgi:hypothetical protein
MAQATQEKQNTERTTYNFGPLEKRGLIAGLTGVQTATLLIGSAATVLYLAGGGSLFLASLWLVVTGLLVFAKRQGRPFVHWVGVVCLYFARKLTGRTTWRSSAPQQGTRIRIPIDSDGEADLNAAQIVARPCDIPDPVGRISILETDYSATQRLGVIADRATNAYMCAFVCTSPPFVFEDRTTQEHKLARWGGWQAGIARSGVFSRVQWIERTVVSGTDDIEQWFETHRTLAEDTSQVQSYRQLLQGAGAVSREHDLILVLQIRHGNPAIDKRVKRHGRDDEGLSHVLATEAKGAIDRLHRSDIANAEPLSAQRLASVIRDAYDPFERPNRERLIANDPTRDGISPERAWPLATQESAHSYLTDSALHRTMWLGEWPRLEVDPGFLSPLLLQTEGIRTVSVIMEPVAPHKSLRKAEGAVHQDVTDEAIRRRLGFIPTARRRREQDAALKRERQLVQGHAEMRMAGFLTVSVPFKGQSPYDALDTASASAQDAAQLSLLEPDSRPGEQAQAFTCAALPLCRGI